MGMNYQIEEQSEDKYITIGSLQKRISTELSDLAILCVDVENVVGEFIESPNESKEKTIITLQNLDKIRQVLENLSRVADFLASQSVRQKVQASILKKDVREQILLHAVAERLTQTKKEPG